VKLTEIKGFLKGEKDASITSIVNRLAVRRLETGLGD
jgi:hypothetical protein